MSTKTIKRSRALNMCLRPASTGFDIDVAIEVLDSGSETDIYAQFKLLCKHLANDPDKMSCMLLTKTDQYDLDNWRHRYLLNWVFHTIGLKESRVKGFLDTVPVGPMLSWMGVNRVTNKATGAVHYRTRTGFFP